MKMTKYRIKKKYYHLVATELEFLTFTKNENECQEYRTAEDNHPFILKGVEIHLGDEMFELIEEKEPERIEFNKSYSERLECDIIYTDFDISDEQMDVCNKAVNGELVEWKTINIPKGEGCLDDDETTDEKNTEQKESTPGITIEEIDKITKAAIDLGNASPTIDNGTKKYTQREMIQKVDEWIDLRRIQVIDSGIMEASQLFNMLPHKKSFKDFLKDK